MKDFHLKTGPFVKSNNSTKKMMLHLLIALIPIIIFNFYKNGIVPYQHGSIEFIKIFYPLVFILVPTLTSFLTELLYALLFLKKKNVELKDYLSGSFSIFPGLFLGLILPINTPLSIVIFGAFIATFVGKLLFGGFGNNVFNPALIGRLFIISSYAIVISNSGGYLNPYELDTISSSTPLTNAAMVEGIGTYETLVTPYGSLTNFFIGTIPGALGEVSALLCLIAFIYLTITKVIKWKIPATYILTVFLITYMIGSVNNLGIWYPLFQIFSGGLMFGAVFMATDPVTSPTTPVGQILYGLFLGVLTVIFRYLTPLPEGVLTSILTMNMFVFIIDRIGAKARFNFKHAFILFLFAWILVIGTGSMIGSSYQQEETITDPNYNIISKEINGNKTKYLVSQKGYSSVIEASIVISNGEVESFEIISQNDSFYQKVEDANYIKSLINSQKDLPNLDTVSGATVTSNALRQMLINTLKDYNGGQLKPSDNNNNIENDSAFKVISHERVENEDIFTVTQKSFGGNIRLRITFKNGIIETITVLEHNDSYFNLLLNDNYIQKLIANQQVLDDLDTVSGATISSSSLKTAIINTKKEYEENYAR